MASTAKEKGSKSKADEPKASKSKAKSETGTEPKATTETPPDAKKSDEEPMADDPQETVDSPFVPEGLWDRPGVAECIDALWARPGEAQLRQEIADWIGRPGESLVDVGCGSARIAELFGSEYVGVDPSRELLLLAPEDVDVQRCSADSLPFGDGYAATVLCANVFRHLMSYQSVLREIARIADRRVFLVDAFRHGETESGTVEVCGEEFADVLWSYEELLTDLAREFPGWTIDKRTFTSPLIVGLRLEAPKK